MNGNTPTILEGEAEKDGEPDVSQLFAARREEEIARRDRSLAEFLVMLDGYKPLVNLLFNRSDPQYSYSSDILLITSLDTGRSNRVLSPKSRIRLFRSKIVS